MGVGRGQIQKKWGGEEGGGGEKWWPKSGAWKVRRSNRWGGLEGGGLAGRGFEGNWRENRLAVTLIVTWMAK